MQKAQKRDACRSEKFWFRKDITQKKATNQTNGSAANETNYAETNGDSDGGEYELMTVDQIINGKGEFPGLVPLIHSYLSSMDVDTDTHCTIQQYLKLIQKRAAGKLLTTASWIRQEVLNHPDYKYVTF